MNLLSILKGPIGEIIGGVRGVINDLHTSDAEKLEAQLKLSELDVAFKTKVMEAEAEWAKTQAEVIKAEIQSESWMARNWRPILMLTFTYIIAHNFVVAPLFGAPRAEVPFQMWDLLQVGMGGYIFGRSAEKIVPQIADAIKKR